MHRPNQNLQNLKFSRLYRLPFAHKVVPQFVPHFGPFLRAFKALRALKGPLIKFSHILLHRPCPDLQNLKFSCLYLIPFSHKVVPQKASGRGSVGSGVGNRVVYHTSTEQYLGPATPYLGLATFSFLFF